MVRNIKTLIDNIKHIYKNMMVEKGATKNAFQPQFVKLEIKKNKNFFPPKGNF
jgi:hypothetical protein